MIRLLPVVALALLNTSANANLPTFVQKSADVYEGFSALPTPRSDVPIGALWVVGYGPHGEAAAAGDLETVRGLTSLILNRDLELRLTAGILSALGIDPGIRRQFTARFTDLSIVRVKDASQLLGPSEAPRIIEALKAGSVVITSERAVDLDLQRPGFVDQFNVKLESGGRNGFSLEAKDMYVAIHIAQMEESLASPRIVALSPRDNLLVGELDGLAIRVQVIGCTKGADKCILDKAAVSLRPHDTSQLEPLNSVGMRLPLPKSDGRGGVLTSIRLNLIAPCFFDRRSGCGKNVRLRTQLVGRRLKHLSISDMPGWRL